jgi:cytochrome P450
VLFGGDQCGLTSEAMTTLLRTHFRGITAVPVSVEFMGLTNNYAAGQNASNEIRTALAKGLETLGKNNAKGNFTFMDAVIGEISTGHITHEEGVTHLVLFHCMINAKALASLMCSLVLESVKNPTEWEEICADVAVQKTVSPSLSRFLKETIRLNPPVIGCMRAVDGGEFEIDGYKIPNTRRLWGCMWTANRDPAVYNTPDAFIPERWTDPHVPPSTTFNGCVAWNLAETIMLEFLIQTCCMCTFSAASIPEDMKYIPTVRPLHPWLVTVRMRDRSSYETKTPNQNT